MEKRKEILRSKRVCRFCLKLDEPLTSIYDRSIRAKNSVPLPLQIMACVAIEVFPSDGMPGTICSVCRHFMDQSYRFKQICKQADEALRHFISHGDLRGPIPWPADMIKYIPEALLQTQNPPAVEEEYSEEDEDMESCTIKLEPAETVKPAHRPGNRAATEPPSQIHVRHGDVEMVITEDDADTANEMMDDEEEDVSSQVPAEVPTNVFPCDQCQRSFPLQQLLDIHKRIHQRTRTHHCQICDRSFFTKYDLQKHSTIHSGLKPHQCIVCTKSFARLTLLRRHEKVHTSAPKLLCSECDQAFLSSAELDEHRMRRHSHKRPFRCDQCPKRFAFKQGLDRHAACHTQDKPNKCNYCPRSFNNTVQLMRHIQGHAGERPYPCKFCPKSFLMSHHYTRHLRTKHVPEQGWGNKMKSTDRSLSDSFKCVQCDETFQKQDDLIFHSAVHATQDLTCPLCKEKFFDVDTVTLHIKSHIEGEQFVCEWCELVFNCEEKLDLHIDAEHRDAVQGDPYSEITYLEGRLVDESELLTMNQPYEDMEEEEEEDEDEDGYYENNQADDKTTIPEEEEEEEEDEFEEDTKYQATLEQEEQHLEMTSQEPLEVSFEMERNQTEEAVGADPQKTEEDSKPTYIELKTVQPPQLANKPIDIIQKQQQPAVKSSILQKAEEVKNQRKLQEELREKQRSTLSPGNKSHAVLQRVSTLSKTPESKKGDMAETVVTSNASSPSQNRLPPLAASQKVSTTVVSKSVSMSLKSVKDALKNSSDKKLQSKEMPKVMSKSSTSPQKEALRKPLLSSGSSLRSPDGDRKKDKSEEKVEPASRTNEKSLKLLEIDLMELKKNSNKSPLNSDRNSANRFLTRKDGRRRESREEERRGDSFKSPATAVSVKKGFLQREEKHRFKSGPDGSSTPTTSSHRGDKLLRSKNDDAKLYQKRSVSPEDSSSPPRRSRRPSKIKDYAAMIRERSGMEDDEESSSEESEDDIPTPPPKKEPQTPASSATGTPATGKRGRGRPRKYPLSEDTNQPTPATPAAKRPSKVPESDEPKKKRGRPKLDRTRAEQSISMPADPPNVRVNPNRQVYPTKPSNPSPVVTSERDTLVKSAALATSTPLKQFPRITKIDSVLQGVSSTGQTVLMSPSGQPLKKLSADMVRQLPPGVRPLPLPPRSQLTEMKIGPKVVRVQKILMTKSEVDAMAKMGLVQIKDGAMVLKPGIKLPAGGDLTAIKNTLLEKAPAELAAPPAPQAE